MRPRLSVFRACAYTRAMPTSLFRFCFVLALLSLTICARAQNASPTSSDPSAGLDLGDNAPDKKPLGPMGQALQPFVDKGQLAGGVFILATKNKIIEEDAVGYRDLDAKAPEKTDDLFWIASQSKSMTCSVLMMLVDEGKLTVDDPVENYLPEFKDQKVHDPSAPGGKADLVRPVKLRDLMTHTSGLPFSAPMETPTLDVSPLADRVKAYAQLDLMTQPGTKYSYANAGVNTIGRVIEVVTGEKYEDVMNERLFKPLGMTDTTFFPTHDQLGRLAQTYAPKPGLVKTTLGQLHYPLDGPGRYPMPAGGLFSTAEDTPKFLQMLLNGGVAADGTRLLSEASVKMMTSNQIPGVGSYGFGLMIAPDGFNHSGACQSNMFVSTTRGLIRVFMVSEAGAFPGNADVLGAFMKGGDEAAAKAGY